MPTSPTADKIAALPELARRRPLTVFFAVVFGLGIPILSAPALAARDVLPGGGLPMPLFALAVTLLVMLPAAFRLTVLTEGRVGAATTSPGSCGGGSTSTADGVDVVEVEGISVPDASVHS